jgi:hypothetical protein
MITDRKCKGNSANPKSPLDQKTVERFWDKVEKREPDECWEWTACTDRDGYGRFSVNGKKCRAHRVAVRIDGRNPTEKVVRHTCDNPSCVNPNHLKLGTQSQNIRDRDRRGRQAKGAQNGQSKLSPNEVLDIRNSTRPSRELAKKYDVSASQIRSIKRYGSWKHLP